MSIIGKIVKNKLDQRQFEFREEYWKKLEKKLDEHRGSGKAGYGNLISGSVGIIVLFSAAILSFYLLNESDTVTDELLPAASQPSVAITQPEQNQTPEKNYSKEMQDNNEAEQQIATDEKIMPGAGNPVLSAETQKYNAGKNEYQGSEKDFHRSGNTETATGGKSVYPKAVINQVVNQPGIQADEETAGPEAEPIAEERTPDSKESAFSSFIAVSESRDQQELKWQTASLSGNRNTELIPDAEIKILLVSMEKIYPFLPENSSAELKTITQKEIISRRRNNYFAGIYSGIMYTDKILKSKDPGLNEYISRRKNEEMWMLSGNFGISAGMSFNRWSLSTGINYHQQGEITDYRAEFYQWIKNTSSTWNVADNSYWKTDTINNYSITVTQGGWQPIDTIIDYWSNNQLVQSDTITIQQYVVDTQYTQMVYVTDSGFVAEFDSTEIIQTDSLNQLVNDPSLKPGKTITKISYVEIPLMVGYEFPLSRFTLMVRTGFSIGLLSKINAVYLKNDISGVEEADVSRVNRTMLNFLLQTGMCYHLTENISLNFEPMFRMNINSALKEPGFTQQYWNAGMNVGAMYRF